MGVIESVLNGWEQEWEATPSTPASGCAVVCARTELLRGGLADALRRCPGMTDIEVLAGATTLAERCRLIRPSIVVLELANEGLDLAARAAAATARLSPTPRVVGIATGNLADADITRMMAAGLSGLVSVQSPLSALWQALGIAPLSSNGNGKAAAGRTTATRPRLTSREIEILSHIAAGRTVSDIGTRLGISPKTIENHKQRIYTKLGVQSQAQAVALAFREGLMTPEAMAPGDGQRGRPVRLVIGDENSLVRGLIGASCDERGIDVVAEPSTLAEVVAAARALIPDVVLLADPDRGEETLETVSLLTTMGIRVIVFSNHWAAEQVMRLLTAKAAGFLMHDSAPGQLADAVTAVARGGAALHAKAARLILSQWQQGLSSGRTAGIDLTRRELEVLSAMAEGLAAKSIARQLGMAVKTVENHKMHVFDKLGAHNQAHAVSIAIGQGLLGPQPASPFA